MQKDLLFFILYFYLEKSVLLGALFSQSFAFVVTVAGLTGRHTTIAAGA